MTKQLTGIIKYGVASMQGTTQDTGILQTSMATVEKKEKGWRSIETEWHGWRK